MQVNFIYTLLYFFKIRNHNLNANYLKVQLSKISNSNLKAQISKDPRKLNSIVRCKQIVHMTIIQLPKYIIGLVSHQQ